MQRADSTALNLDYSQYTHVQKENLLALLQEKERRINSRQILDLYPDTGPLRRELYVPHVKFFEAGAKYRERCFMAANRVGKTYGVGGYELALHLTGRYPLWWKGVAGGLYSGADPLTRLLYGVIGKADGGKGGQAAGDIYLHLDLVGVYAECCAA